MSYYASEQGTITLSGDWTQEPLTLLNTVMDSWVCYDESEGLFITGQFSADTLTISYQRSGKGLTENMICDFDEEVQDGELEMQSAECPVSRAQYDRLLKLMHDSDLSIQLQVSVVGEGNERWSNQVQYTSNGETLEMEELNAIYAERAWLDLGVDDLDNAVAFFQSLAADADEYCLREWVEENIAPTRIFECYKKGDFHTSDLPFGEIEMQDFADKFSPNTEAWHQLVHTLKNELAWFPEDPPKEDELVYPF